MEQDRMKVERPGKLLLSLAIPAICAQIITLLYNMVDRIYIGRLADGPMAIAGIGLCVPIVTVFTAFTGLFGRGGAPLAAISLGRQEKEEAEKFLGNSFCCLLSVSLIITVFVMIFKDSLLMMFGASEHTLSYASDYLGIYCLGTVFIQLTVGMNYYITTQGFARTAMLSTMIGGVLNIVLDPIFIFGMKMGVAGAALATVIAQFVSCVWVMTFLFGKKTKVRIRIRNMRLDKKIMRQIFILGMSPFFMSASEGVMHICFNMQVQKCGGDLAVSAMTILFSMFQFIQLPIEGVASGSQPIVGYNYGAGEFGRVRETLKIAMSVCLAISFTGASLMLLFPSVFIRIFNSDPELVALGAKMLRVYIFGCLTIGANSMCQQTYTSLGEGKRSFTFAFLRKIILLIPLLYILPALLPFGVFAVVLAEPVSDLVTTIANTASFRGFLRKKLAVKQ